MSIWGKRVDSWVDSRPKIRYSNSDALGVALVVIVFLLLAPFLLMLD